MSFKCVFVSKQPIRNYTIEQLSNSTLFECDTHRYSELCAAVALTSLHELLYYYYSFINSAIDK